ncbi:MAG: PASTA domain-containing protein [Armatimonadetes bacterium]|nr:PASTA domain-containing protein [Armatimonadota bacterium]
MAEEQQEVEYEQEPAPLVGILRTAAYTLLILFLVGGAWWLYRSIHDAFFHATEEVMVPRVIGKEPQEAKRIVEETGLGFNIESNEYHQWVPAGQIIRQEPIAGKMVKKNRVLRVVVSNGQELVQVPDVRGKSLREAKILLGNARLLFGKPQKGFADDIPPGQVISSSPPGNATVSRGTSVVIKISDGPPPKVSVPELEGKSLTDARKILSDKGLRVGQVLWSWNDKIAFGTIVSQTPEANEDLKVDSMLSFQVSAGPRKGELFFKQSHLYFVVPPGKGKQKVKITSTDITGTNVVYESDHLPGASVQLEIANLQDALIEVYVNGKVVTDAKL